MVCVGGRRGGRHGAFDRDGGTGGRVGDIGISLQPARHGKGSTPERFLPNTFFLIAGNEDHPTDLGFSSARNNGDQSSSRLSFFISLSVTGTRWGRPPHLFHHQFEFGTVVRVRLGDCLFGRGSGACQNRSHRRVDLRHVDHRGAFFLCHPRVL